MSIRLKVTNQNTSKSILEEEFSSDVITIGRDFSNSVTLQDDKKSISRNHAEILYDNGLYFVKDLGSINGTCLNNRMLQSNIPVELKNEAIIKIGKYVIVVNIFTKTSDKYYGDGDQENPYLEECKNYASVLKQLYKIYASENSRHRNEKLVSAIKNVTNEKDMREMIEFLSKIYDSPQTEIDSQIQITNDPEKRADQYFNKMLLLFAKSIQVMKKFKTEFVGTTMIQSGESILMESPKKLRKFLLESGLTDINKKKRFSFFESQIEESILHQVALLDGYRQCVKEGVPNLLNKLNPSQIKKELMGQYLQFGPLKIPFAIIPFFRTHRILEIIQKRQDEFNADSGGVIERKIFRPPFIRNYLESLRSSEKNKN